MRSRMHSSILSTAQKCFYSHQLRFLIRIVLTGLGSAPIPVSAVRFIRFNLVQDGVNTAGSRIGLILPNDFVRVAPLAGQRLIDGADEVSVAEVLMGQAALRPSTNFLKTPKESCGPGEASGWCWTE